jgi:hypothetical protein
MNKDQITLKNEKLSTRCEICHKDDFYDPVTNICSRCNLKKADLDNAKQTIDNDPKAKRLVTSFGNRLAFGGIATVTTLFSLLFIYLLAKEITNVTWVLGVSWPALMLSYASIRMWIYSILGQPQKDYYYGKILSKIFSIPVILHFIISVISIIRVCLKLELYEAWPLTLIFILLLLPCILLIRSGWFERFKIQDYR